MAKRTSKDKANNSYPVWICCNGCGLFQVLPDPIKGHKRVCSRCYSPFGSGLLIRQTALALAATSLILFTLAQLYPLIGIEILGRHNIAHIGSGVQGLADHNLLPLSILVFGIAIAVPLYRIFVMLYVLAGLHFRWNLPYMIALFRLSERLRPWAMLDVFLLGAIVAQSKLQDLAQTNFDAGFWALCGAVLSVIFLDVTSDQSAIWDWLKSPIQIEGIPNHHTSVGCHSCHMVQNIDHKHCLRCHAPLHRRKPNSINRTTALVIAGFILYIPANLYPVFTLISFGRRTTTTIMGGVIQLLNGQDWPLAIIVFTASIAFPLMKLIGLSWLMLSTKIKLPPARIDRTKLYRFISLIGRWSNIDVFVAALLTALVTLGAIATIEPGIGVLAFGSVVVLTMLAAESFDPKLMWDKMERQNG